MRSTGPPPPAKRSGKNNSFIFRFILYLGVARNNFPFKHTTCSVQCYHWIEMIPLDDLERQYLPLREQAIAVRRYL